MSETIDDENPSVTNNSNLEQDQTVEDTNISNDNEETWFYKNSESKITDNTSQEFEDKEKSNRSLIIGFEDDSDDDDNVQVTIGDYKPDTPTFQRRPPIPVPPKPFITRNVVDIDAQGVINGQSTFEHDIATAYKDDEKPWKKPGADITDYFNYGFTEETWTQYCERQRRLRSENNLARMNINHIPPMGPMNPMLYPMNIRPMTMINRPMNMQMVPRPINTQPSNGKIGVIGSTDRTSRRSMYETPGGFDYQSFPPTSDPSSNSNHVTPINNTHPIPTLGAQRLPMMNLPHGMLYRPPYIGSQFLPQGSVSGMPTDRLNIPQPYFIPPTESNDGENTGRTSSRSPTPEQERPHENEKLSRDSRSRHHHRSSPSKHRSHEYERPRDEKSDHYSRRYHRSKRSRRESDNDDGEHHRRSRHRSSDNKNQRTE